MECCTIWLVIHPAYWNAVPYIWSYILRDGVLYHMCGHTPCVMECWNGCAIQRCVVIQPAWWNAVSYSAVPRHCLKRCPKQRRSVSILRPVASGAGCQFVDRYTGCTSERCGRRWRGGFWGVGLRVGGLCCVSLCWWMSVSEVVYS